MNHCKSVSPIRNSGNLSIGLHIRVHLPRSNVSELSINFTYIKAKYSLLRSVTNNVIVVRLRGNQVGWKNICNCKRCGCDYNARDDKLIKVNHYFVAFRNSLVYIQILRGCKRDRCETLSSDCRSQLTSLFSNYTVLTIRNKVITLSCC